jgi:MFS family permease
MTAAGAVGLLAAVPAGRFCDRGRPQAVLAAALATMAAASFGFVVARTVPEVLAVACLYNGACQSAYTSRGALAALVAPDGPAKLNAALYRLGNVGYAAATLAIGVAATSGTAAAYRTVLGSSGGAFALAAFFAARVRAGRPLGESARPTTGARRSRPWRDPRYLALTVLYAVTSTQFCIAEFVLPLWIVEGTHAPRAMAGVAAFISTVVVATLQPRASRHLATSRRAAGAMAVAGITAGVGCLALAAAAGRGSSTAAVLIAAGALALAVAELCQAVGSITLSYSLAPVEECGTYQGFFGLGQGLAMAAGPAVLAHIVLRPGAGWPSTAAFLAVAGLLVPAVVRPRPIRTAQSTAESGGHR